MLDWQKGEYMYCGNCGSQNEDNANKCFKCGYALKQMGDGGKPPGKIPNYLVPSIFLTLLDESATRLRPTITLRRSNMRKNYITAGSILVLVVLFSACASVYYPLETAKESPYYGKIDKRQAAEIVMKQARLSGSNSDLLSVSHIDPRSFLADTVGMSFRKTEKKKRTEFRDAKLVEVEYQEVTIQNVPWEMVMEIRPMHNEHGILGVSYFIKLVYRFSALDSYGRYKETAEIDFVSSSREQFVNVLAAFRTLIR
jgi:hypothetical protein